MFSMQGKTLAFVLPILESLTNGPAKASRKTGYGRAPSVLVLLPTRELANQVRYEGYFSFFPEQHARNFASLTVTSVFSNFRLGELQVHADFEVYGGAVGLSCCCLYGGAPYHSQETKLKRGVDVVIGTPGRVKVTFYYHVHFSQNFQLY